MVTLERRNQQPVSNFNSYGSSRHQRVVDVIRETNQCLNRYAVESGNPENRFCTFAPGFGLHIRENSQPGKTVSRSYVVQTFHFIIEVLYRSSSATFVTIVHGYGTKNARKCNAIYLMSTGFVPNAIRSEQSHQTHHQLCRRCAAGVCFVFQPLCPSTCG